MGTVVVVANASYERNQISNTELYVRVCDANDFGIELFACFPQFWYAAFAAPWLEGLSTFPDDLVFHKVERNPNNQLKVKMADAMNSILNYSFVVLSPSLYAVLIDTFITCPPYTPNHQTSPTNHPPQCATDPFLPDINIVQVQMPSVAPELPKHQPLLFSTSSTVFLLYPRIKFHARSWRDQSNCMSLVPTASHAGIYAFHYLLKRRAHEIRCSDVIPTKEPHRRAIRAPPKHLFEPKRVVLLSKPDLCWYDAALVVDPHQYSQQNVENNPDGEV